jgi:RNA polymerase sigma factor (sigma-70 family)
MKISKEIINDLKGESNRAFGDLYKNYFGLVQHYIIRNNGSAEDAQDVFQEAMIVLVEKLRQDNFQLTASLKTYIMAISKYMWLNKLRNGFRVTEFTDLHSNSFFEEINLSIEQEKTYRDKLQAYMTKITGHCNRLLHDMFFKKKPIEQIQEEYGYSSKHNAQNQKHKCIEQIRKVKEQDKGE